MLTPEQQAAEASVGAVLFQCETMYEQLEGFAGKEYPAQTRRLATLYRVYLEAVHRKLSEQHRQLRKTGFLKRHQRANARRYTRMARRFFEAIRYLASSIDHVAKPSLQAAMQDLIDRCWPAQATGCGPEDVVALVRGRWNYNFTHYSISEHLEDCLVDSDRVRIDRHADRATLCNDVRPDWTYPQWLERLYARAGVTERPPRHASILSFPRLDQNDLLLSPMLGHELGHLIDAAVHPPLVQQRGVLPAIWFPRADDLSDVEPTPISSDVRARATASFEPRATQGSASEELHDLSRAPIVERRAGRHVERTTREQTALASPGGAVSRGTSNAPVAGDAVDAEEAEDLEEGTQNADDTGESSYDSDALIGHPVELALRPIFSRRGLQPGDAAKYVRAAQRMISDTLEEFTADLIATRLLGVPFVIALAEFLKTSAAPTDPLIMPGKEEVRSYPGARYRLQVAARELLDSEVHTRLRELAERDQTRSLIHVLDYLERQRNATARSAPFPADSPVAAVLEFAESTVADTMQRLPGRVHDLVPQDHLASLNDGLLALLREMHDPSRPSLTVTATTTYSQVLMAGWCFQLHYGDGQEEQGLPGRYDDHQQRLPTNKAAEHYRRTNEILADALNRILAQHALLDESPTAAQRADLSSEDVSVTPESDTSLEPEVRSI